MTTLDKAQELVTKRDAAQADINYFLAPFLRDYIEFMDEVSPNYYDKYDRKADTFEEIDDETFHFKGEVVYEYREDHYPSVSLPFSFVSNPILFKDAARADKAEQEARQAANRARNKAEQIARLEDQLAKARAEV